MYKVDKRYFAINSTQFHTFVKVRPVASRFPSRGSPVLDGCDARARDVPRKWLRLVNALNFHSWRSPRRAVSVVRFEVPVGKAPYDFRAATPHSLGAIRGSRDRASVGAQDLKLTQRAETHEGVIFKQVPLRMCGPKRVAMGLRQSWLSCGRNCPGCRRCVP